MMRFARETSCPLSVYFARSYASMASWKNHKHHHAGRF